MDDLPLRAAALHDGTPTPEQDAAYDWADGFAAVDRLPLAALSDGSLADYDTVWWHHDRPFGEVELPAGAADALRGYVADGGGLLLTLRALAAVEPLGIDPVAPDATGAETVGERAGYLPKRVHADHPLFEALGPRFHTRAAGAEAAFARYERVLPADGHVLAGGYHGDRYVVGHKPLVEWRVGDGHVLGIGASLAFHDVRDFECGATQEQFVRNALTLLAGERWPAFTDRPAEPSGFAAMRDRLADDHHRPRYHLTAPAGWLNDPNGLVHHDGVYHVFYQYNPGGPYHGCIHWGHATSEDLVTWTDRPLALAPDPDGPDRDGCWSGCTVIDDGTPTVLYTGGRGREQLPCLATATDDALSAFEKHDGNPVIERAPDGLDILETADWAAEFRDHCVWREGDEWFHLIGSGVAGQGGTALLYRGETLEDWAFVGPLLTGADGDGTVWECPELLDLGERSLLQVSNYETTRYFLGDADLDAPGFEVAATGTLDHGAFYAPQTMRSADGTLLMWGWLPEARDEAAQWDAGWSGVLSLPRELSLADDGDIRQRPAPALAALREERVHGGDRSLAADEPHALALTGNAYELRTTATLGESDLLVRLFETPAGTERTHLRVARDGVTVERERSSGDPRVDHGDQHMPLPDAETHDLRLFVDGSMLELFVDERHCLTSRVYPTRRDAEGVTLVAEGGPVTLAPLDVWTLGSAYR